MMRKPLFFTVGILLSIFIFFLSVHPQSVLADDLPTISASFFRQFEANGLFDHEVSVDSPATIQSKNPRLSFTATTSEMTGAYLVAKGINTPSGATSATVNITPAGSNRILLASISYGGGNDIQGVTFGGTPLTRVCTYNADGFHTDMWYLVNPAASAGDVVATADEPKDMLLTAAAFANVDQSTPLNDSDCTGSSGPWGNYFSTYLDANSNQLIFAGATSYVDGQYLFSPDTAQQPSNNRTGNIIGATQVTESNTPYWQAIVTYPWSIAAVALKSSGSPVSDSYTAEYEVQLVGTPFSDTATVTTPFTFTGIQHVVVGQVTGLTANNAYVWQARLCNDDTLACSSWVQYDNLGWGSDFYVATNASPNIPSSLGGTAGVTDGSTIFDDTPQLAFHLEDPDYISLISYHVQVSTHADFSDPVVDYLSQPRPRGDYSFTIGQDEGEGNYTFGTSGQTLADGTYYWRVSALDNSGDADTENSVYAVANSGDPAFTLDAGTDPNRPKPPETLLQYQSNDIQILPVDSDSPDQNQHLIVSAAKNNGTGPALVTSGLAKNEDVTSISKDLSISGTNKVIVAYLAFSNETTVTSVTLGGQNFTNACSTDLSTDGGFHSSIWYLVAPPNGTGTITANLESDYTQVVMSVAQFSGVNQSSPISHFACEGSQPYTYTPHISIDTAVGETVFGGASTYTDGINLLRPEDDMVEVTHDNTGVIQSETSMFGSQGSTQSMDWQMNVKWPWSVAAVSLAPADSYSQVNLIPRVEVRALGVGFTNAPTATGSAVPYNGAAVLGNVSTGDLAQASYHWQAQVCSEDFASCSLWTSFGGNSEASKDYAIVANIAPDVPGNLGPESLLDASSGSLAPTFSFSQTDGNWYDMIQYQIIVSENSDFSSPVIDFTSVPVILHPVGSGVLPREFWVGQDDYGGSYATGSPGQTLEVDHTYYWKVRGIDQAGEVSAYTTSKHFTVDTEPPVVSNQHISASDTSITITWDTDKVADSLVSIGPTGQGSFYTNSQDDSPRVLNHSFTVSGLLPCVAYDVQPVSFDIGGNRGNGDPMEVTTSGCTGNADILDSSSDSIDSDTGGTVDLLDTGTGVSLDIPSDAFATESASLQIKKLDTTQVLGETSTPSGYTLAGDFTYDFHAIQSAFQRITTFDHPILVTMSYDDEDTAGLTGSLVIYRWDEGEWTALTNCTQDTDAKTITCETTHFSTFALFSGTTPSGGGDSGNGNGGGSGSGSSDGGGGSSGPSVCTLTAPNNAPQLFQIDRAPTEATLFFTPIGGGDVGGYTVSYGTTPSANQYSAHFDGQQNGVIVQKIGALAKNGAYFFRVQATRDCTAGPWSNTVVSSGNTKRSFMGSVNQFLNPIKAKIGIAPVPTSGACEGAWCNPPGGSPTPSSQPEASRAPVPQKSPEPQTQSQSSFFQKISGFFGSLFGKH